MCLEQSRVKREAKTKMMMNCQKRRIGRNEDGVILTSPHTLHYDQNQPWPFIGNKGLNNLVIFCVIFTFELNRNLILLMSLLTSSLSVTWCYIVLRMKPYCYIICFDGIDNQWDITFSIIAHIYWHSTSWFLSRLHVCYIQHWNTSVM
jgi:hypothetical protein